LRVTKAGKASVFAETGIYGNFSGTGIRDNSKHDGRN
jgi:hypothetical protein